LNIKPILITNAAKTALKGIHMLGDIIRKIRTDKKVTIKEIAAKAGVTSSLLSQIENNKANPSVNSLMAIAKALKVPMSTFFDDEPLADPVVRAGRRKFLKTQSGVTYYLLTPEPSKHRIGMIYNVFEQGASVGEMYSHEGEECGFILEGSLEVTSGNDTYILETGDSIILDSTKPHKCTNIAEGRTLVIWANSPPTW
jgi:transcriptional regulator with XRE-family HTH domain